MNELCMMDLWQLLCRVKDNVPLQPERIISLYIHFHVMTWSHSRVLEPTRMVGPTLISRISDSDPIGKHFRWTTKYRFVSLGSISRADKRMAPEPRQSAKDVDVIKILHQHPAYLISYSWDNTLLIIFPFFRLESIVIVFAK